MEGWVDLGSLIAARPGMEPTTAWSQVRCPNRYATESPKQRYVATLSRVSTGMGELKCCVNYILPNGSHQTLTMKSACIRCSAMYCSASHCARVRPRTCCLCFSSTTTTSSTNFGQPVWHRVVRHLPSTAAGHWCNFFIFTRLRHSHISRTLHHIYTSALQLRQYIFLQ